MNIVNVMACLSSSDGIAFFEFEDFNNFLFNRVTKKENYFEMGSCER